MNRLFFISALALSACAANTDDASTGTGDELEGSDPGVDRALRGGQTGDEGNDMDTDGGLSPSFDVDEYDQVIVTESYRYCDSDAECILVETSCAFCCGRDAIFRDWEDEYDSAFSLSCEYYSGGVCDCEPPNVQARCVDHRCAAVDVSGE